MSVCVSLTLGIVILVMCGCCCIPCIRTLTERLITTALAKQTESDVPPPYQMPLLAENDDSEPEEDL